MNTIQSLQQTSFNQVSQSSSLRKAAASAELPSLTTDESSLIEEKFTPKDTLQFYSVDGRSGEQKFATGQNIDRRI